MAKPREQRDTSWDARKTIDWWRVIIHGSFGLVIGLLIGLWYFCYFWSILGLVAIIATGLVVAVLAAVYGDDFWEWLLGR
jgi:membrane protein YdbS with pleckstrin-like domain